MPLLRHAKKKLRQDKKRTAANRKVKVLFRSLLKKAKTEKTPEAVSKAFSALDKAAKQNIIHENKAGRLKSSLSKTLEGKGPVVAVAAKPLSKGKAAAKKKAIVAKASKSKSTTKKK